MLRKHVRRTEISCILFRNACFSSKISVFCSETHVFHQKFLFSAQKRAFFIIFFCFLPKNCSFSSKIVVGCSETRVFHQKSLYFVQKLEFFVRNRCILSKNCSFSSEIAVFYQKSTYKIWKTEKWSDNVINQRLKRAFGSSVMPTVYGLYAKQWQRSVSYS